MIMKLPQYIDTSIKITGKSKPTGKLQKPFVFNGNYIIRYIGIKIGGIVFQEQDKTLELAEKKMVETLKYYNIL